MHGLWPDTCSGGIPGSGDSGCDESRNYDDVGSIVKEKDSALYDSMNTYWPSNKGNMWKKSVRTKSDINVSYFISLGDNSKFWTHEWNKHGM